VNLMSTRCGAWIYVLCFSLLSGFAQQNGPAGQSLPPASVPLASSNRQMTLDVVVTDKSGKPLSGLQQQDFTLLDNKQPQKIISFHAVQGTAKDDPPVEVILLVDEINATYTQVAFARDAIQKFLRRNGGELARPVLMAILSDAGIMVGSTPSQDGNALIAEFNQKKAGLRTIGSAQGFYGASDRQQLSLHALQQLAQAKTTTPGRKLVVWISPGWPLLSGPEVGLEAKQRQSIFNAIVALSDGLRRARITLYDVDPLGTEDAAGFRTSYYEGFLKPVTTTRQVQYGNLALQVLAVQSGGRVLNSSNDVMGEIATCVEDARDFYVLSFDALPGDGPNEYHALEIKIDKPKLTAHTRSGYYAQPEQRPQ
jgi:VWFA-related protein